MHTFAIAVGVWLWGISAVCADLYQWTDQDGVIHVVDDAGEVPAAYREGLKVYRAPRPAAGAAPLASPLSPGRTYAENSQGAFAQKLALDLGLIKSSGEDALGPLSGAGIQPAGGWKVSDPLTPEASYEVLAAARRAADSRRLALSADGAEAVVRQVAASFLPAPPAAQDSSPPAEGYSEEPVYDGGPDVVIIEQPPPEVIEVVREPYYVPLPVIVGPPRFHHHPHHDGRPGDKPGPPSPPLPPSGPHTTNPVPLSRPGGPTHLPFGSSHPVSPFMR